MSHLTDTKGIEDALDRASMVTEHNIYYIARQSAVNTTVSRLSTLHTTTFFHSVFHSAMKIRSLFRHFLGGLPRAMFTKIYNTLTAAIFGRDYKFSAVALDPTFYQNRLPGWSLAALDPALHFHLFGWRQSRDPNRFFDTSWYLGRHHDVRRAGMNPLVHYLKHGWREHRDPCPAFETDWYLARYGDVREAGLNPLVHFLQYGKNEGRQPKQSPLMQAIADQTSVIISGGSSFFRTKAWTFTLADFSPEGIRPVLDRSTSTAVGNDPQFLLKRHLPAGFIRVRICCSYSNLRDAASREAVLELFFDSGNGFVAEQAYTYPVLDGRIDINDIILVENGAAMLRIDPINSECTFEMSELNISSVQVDEAIQELYDAFCRNAKGSLRPDREFLERFQCATVVDFVRSQSKTIDIRLDRYKRWMDERRIGPVERKRFVELIETMHYKPSFSVVMPTYKPDLRFLKSAIDSVRSQVYPNWQLCIVDDGSRDPVLAEFIKWCAAFEDRIVFKICIENRGIAQATNDALAIATGDFIALLDHDDELAPQALFRMAEALNEHPFADMLYSDEDKIDESGVRSDPLFKPEWSPEFFLSCMYTCHLTVYRRSRMLQLGGFRSEFDFAQDYDLALRVSAVARTIVHVPDVLYHWRTLPTSTAGGADAKPAAELAARRAVQAHLDARGLRGTALPGPFAGSHRVKLDVLGMPLVSIVIPTAARRITPETPRWYLLDLLRSIRELSSYPRYEIVLVDNGDVEPALESELQSFDAVRVTYTSECFNISEKINFGVDAASGEFVILLNDDMTVITPDWIEELIGWIQRPGIIAAGGKLLFPDDTVQHAGVLLLAQGPSHVYYGHPDLDPGLVGSAVIVRNYSAVTGACLAVRKTDYQHVGGFDPFFRVNYNDVDFCLKLLAHGRIVFTPYAKMYHYESVSKDDAPASELSNFNERWSDAVGYDPFYSVHFSQSAANAVTIRPQPLFPGPLV